MAKQDGILPIKGTIDNISFYKTEDGYLARKKGGVDAKRMATDPAFERTRENGAEFGRAGEASKLLVKSLRSLILQASDSKMISRLTRAMGKVIKADITNPRGKRNVIDGEAELLQDFEFNIKGKVAATIFAVYDANINRVTGQLKIDMPSYVPKQMITAPASTTHFQLISAGVEVDFEKKTFVLDTAASGVLPWDGALTPALSLVHTVTVNSTHPLFLALGVLFFKEEGGIQYPLKNGTFNGLALVKVNGL